METTERAILDPDTLAPVIQPVRYDERTGIIEPAGPEWRDDDAVLQGDVTVFALSDHLMGWDGYTHLVRIEWNPFHWLYALVAVED
jgi:hypothetical protein